MRLKNKFALITGAGSGIGRATAIAFAHEGARVALIGRRREPLEQVAREIGAAALLCPGDITRREEIERVVGQASAAFGTLNVLVNNAALLIAGTAESQTERDWDETFAANVKGLWLLSRAVLPHMRRAGGGSIINVASVVGLIGARNRTAYGASKGAVITLSKCMAADHAHQNIRVNCVCPGIVETELVADFVRKAPDPQAARRQRVALHPMGRFGQPEDVANAILYLASDESSWVTGAAFPIDGGYTASKA